ncbi:MAG: hypothetical protein ACNA8K_10660 [Cyclonatronaceae bacterium]
MPERRSYREELLELVTAIVDGEASEKEKERYLRAARDDSYFHHALEREKKIKNVIATRSHRAKTPEHLAHNIRTLIATEARKSGATSTAENTRISSISGSSQSSDSVKRKRRPSYFSLFAVAAAFLLAALLHLYQGTVSTESYIVEDLVFEHYNNHGGSLLPVSFASESTGHAEQILSNDYNISLTVPELQGASFSGVVYAEFVSGYHTPLIEYTVDDGDHIYVFAFCLDELKKYRLLERDNAAVNRITDINDVYIKEIGGKHVVSWKWHDVWYSAISNHNGETIASMLPKH